MYKIVLRQRLRAGVGKQGVNKAKTSAGKHSTSGLIAARVTQLSQTRRLDTYVVEHPMAESQQVTKHSLNHLHCKAQLAPHLENAFFFLPWLSDAIPLCS